jgi:hypothetical protein
MASQSEFGTERPTLSLNLTCVRLQQYAYALGDELPSAWWVYVVLTWGKVRARFCSWCRVVVFYWEGNDSRRTCFAGPKGPPRLGNRLPRRFRLGLASAPCGTPSSGVSRGGQVRSVTPSLDGQLGLRAAGSLGLFAVPHVARAQPRRLPRSPTPRARRLQLSRPRQ